MFLSRNKKNNVYPRKPQFYCIKVWFKGIKTLKAYFREVITLLKDHVHVDVTLNTGSWLPVHVAKFDGRL